MSAGRAEHEAYLDISKIEDEIESKGDNETECMRFGASRTRAPSSKCSTKVPVDFGDWAPHFANATSSSIRRVSSSNRRQLASANMQGLGQAKSNAHAEAHSHARSASDVEKREMFLEATTMETTTAITNETSETLVAAADEEEAVLYVDVQLRFGCHRIAVYADDDVAKVASRFCAINGVSAGAEEELYQHLCHLLMDTCS
jgi:hypothetical protein